MVVGQRVLATTRITDTGLPEDPWVHAEDGDGGTVVAIPEEDAVFTVRFDRTGTLTDVSPFEVVKGQTVIWWVPVGEC